MKIRNGFVSNSSSSSFIVAFPTKPTSAEEVCQILFGDKKQVKHEYDNNYIDTMEIAKIVFKDIMEQEPNDVKKMKGNFDADDNYKTYERQIAKELGEKEIFNLQYPIREKAYNLLHEKLEKDKDIELEKFINNNKNYFIYCFDYSDNDGQIYTHMEHGGIFDALDYRISSHH